MVLSLSRPEYNHDKGHDSFLIVLWANLQDYTRQNCHCSCLYKANGAGIVLKVNVRFMFLLGNNRESYTVSEFQSWRTSNLFLQPINGATNVDVYLTDANAIRPTVTAITQHIKYTNGGWTICGWL
jgi:hypothetical protein